MVFRMIRRCPRSSSPDHEPDHVPDEQIHAACHRSRARAHARQQGRPVRRRDRARRRDRRGGLERGHLDQRPDRACGGGRDSPRLRGSSNTFNLSDCEIYASCEPCPMCLGAIYWGRFRTLYFANTRDEAAAIGFDDEFIYGKFRSRRRRAASPGITLRTPHRTCRSRNGRPSRTRSDIEDPAYWTPEMRSETGESGGGSRARRGKAGRHAALPVRALRRNAPGPAATGPLFGHSPRQ